jgi:hypothetical protein
LLVRAGPLKPDLDELPHSGLPAFVPLCDIAFFLSTVRNGWGSQKSGGFACRPVVWFKHKKLELNTVSLPAVLRGSFQTMSVVEFARPADLLRRHSSEPLADVRVTDVSCLHASLHLHRLRHAVFALRGSARCVSNLHRRAAVRPCLGPVLDHAGAARERAQQQVPPPRDRGLRPSRPPQRSASGSAQSLRARRPATCCGTASP